MLFSQRKGLKLTKTEIQISSVDDELRNSLWNAFYLFFYKAYTLPDVTGTMRIDDYHTVLSQKLWLDYFKKTLDKFDTDARSALDKFKKYFFECEWYEVYDFIEFSAKVYPDDELSQRFRIYCNGILEKEISAYRFVDETIAQITSEVEVETIEDALMSTSSIAPINTHLKRSLELLSDRTSPDYRNSIKESISAVEAISKLITGNKGTTLGAALNEIEKRNIVEVHSNLKEAFKQLYWYTSDAAGIRHAIKDNSTVSFEDAKFMLVACSAFTNYLIVQATKSGLKI